MLSRHFVSDLALTAWNVDTRFFEYWVPLLRDMMPCGLIQQDQDRNPLARQGVTTGGVSHQCSSFRSTAPQGFQRRPCYVLLGRRQGGRKKTETFNENAQSSPRFRDNPHLCILDEYPLSTSPICIGMVTL